MKRPGLTAWIAIAMFAGILIGLLIHFHTGDAWKDQFTKSMTILIDIFLRLIKMIIAPLVFSSLVTGIAKLGDIRALGRIGGKTLLWFLGASLLSLMLGLVIMNIMQLGSELHLPVQTAAVSDKINPGTFSIRNYVTHVFPQSIIEAMANNEILQIVVFSIFFGVATAAVGENGKIIIRALESVTEIILKLTGYIMHFAPVAAFASVSVILALRGPEILKTYGQFILAFYLSILLLWILLISVSSIWIGKKSIKIIGRIKDMVLLAFTTASSEAAFPQLIEELNAAGCPRKIVSFVLPLGYSFNLDGSMLYQSFSALFIAQAYGMHLTLGTQITMLLVLLLTSKGIAGVPRASLVVIATILPMFQIPPEGVMLLLGIDQIMDMARSATNVVGNSLASAVICKMEGVLED